MKKVVIAVMVAALCLALTPISSHAAKTTDRQPGGIPAFLVGCIWGIREGTEWNEGADMHWREWCRIVPFVGQVIMVWDGVDCYRGMTSHDWAKKNAVNWY